MIFSSRTAVQNFCGDGNAQKRAIATLDTAIKATLLTRNDSVNDDRGHQKGSWIMDKYKGSVGDKFGGVCTEIWFKQADKTNFWKGG
jgi:hypothetical protein